MREGEFIEKGSLESLSEIAAFFDRFSKALLLSFVLVLLALCIISIPLGLEMFLFGNLSKEYYPSSPIPAIFVFSQIKLSLGFAFSAVLSIYALCFVFAWKQKNGFLTVIKGFLPKPLSLHLRNSLFAFPVLSSLTYVVVRSVHFLEESYGVPVGKPPLPADSLLAYFELAVSPLREEIIYRVLPIGVFLTVYLLALVSRRAPPMLWKQRLKISFLAFASPEDAKKKSGLKSVADSGFSGGISFDEWIMILFTSAFFALSHYFLTSTWNVGRIATAFLQGLVAGVSYLVYGIQAPILLHWFFNYYLHTYNLATALHPDLFVLSLLNEKIILSLGVLSLILATPIAVGKLSNTRAFILETLLHFGENFKAALIKEGDRFLMRLRRLGPFDLATLFLTLAILAVRLMIISHPSPQAGSRYYETGFVFDESYYVKASRKLLVGEPSNNEHPPLSKILIMLGIILFGDNPLGWRIFPIVSSSVSIALTYMLAVTLSKSRIVSFSAAFVFATDTMAFNIGQIAMLDAPSMMFALAGTAAILRKRYDLSGLFLGLAALCKLSSVFVAMGAILYLLMSGLAKRDKISSTLLRTVSVAFITLLIGLWIYDARYQVFGGNPLQHLTYMYTYHGGLKYENPEEVILPLQWINPSDPFAPIAYYITTVREIANGGIVVYHPIAYYGVYSPLWWSLWIVAPASLVEAVRRTRKREERGIDLFCLSWIAATFFPYVLFAYVMQRWVYPFYFYLTLPGLYLGLSYYLGCSRLSKILLAFLTLVQLLWFFLWFPVKPRIVIDLLLFLGLPA